MPSKSEAQRKTMQAAAHNPKFAKKVGIPQGVAKDFNDADQQIADELPKKTKHAKVRPKGRQYKLNR